jgi:hypothetical protein
MKRFLLGILGLATLLSLLLGLYAILPHPAPLFAADDGRVDRYPDGLRIGSDGTKITLLSTGTISVLATKTSKTLSVTNAASGDILILTPADSLSTATKFFGTVGTGSITVTVNAAPDAADASALDFGYALFGL